MRGPESRALDHTPLPPLCGKGFRGPIYTPNATRDLCEALWQDAAGLSGMLRTAGAAHSQASARCTPADAVSAWERLIGLRYGEWRDLPGSPFACSTPAIFWLGPSSLVSGGQRRGSSTLGISASTTPPSPH
jgi:hypothetical protein